MKQATKIILLVMAFMFSINNVIAQRTKADSTRIVYRIEKYPCPTENDVFESAASPLPQYCFYSMLTAASTTLDSAKTIQGRSYLTYFFDDSSNYIALKKTSLGHETNNTKQGTFIIEEIVDSLRFEINLNFLGRKPKYANHKNCNGEINIYKIAKLQEAKSYSKTGNAKVFNGFLCSEYLFEDENSKKVLWVTSTDDDWINKIRNDLNIFETYPELLYFSSGIVMVSESYNKKTYVTQRFEVSQINKNSFYRISSDGYVLNLGF